MPKHELIVPTEGKFSLLFRWFRATKYLHLCAFLFAIALGVGSVVRRLVWNTSILFSGKATMPLEQELLLAVLMIAAFVFIFPVVTFLGYAIGRWLKGDT